LLFHDDFRRQRRATVHRQAPPHTLTPPPMPMMPLLPPRHQFFARYFAACAACYAAADATPVIPLAISLPLYAAAAYGFAY
jgi:hypothetical protein